MDGVLVDVTESYRETIAQTVEHFTGTRIPNEMIQDFKNQGGWNDDWKLSHHLVTGVGVEAGFDEVKAYFQSIFHGNGTDGLILREEEAALTLNRFAPHLVFDPVVGMYEVCNHKPAPDGLLTMKAAYYVGDTVDDARCAKAAGVPFIGVAAPSNPRYMDLVFLFQETGAYAIVDDINYLDEVFAS